MPIIAQLQTMAIKQCVRDSSAYVRKAAAHAVAKVGVLYMHTTQCRVRHWGNG